MSGRKRSGWWLRPPGSYRDDDWLLGPPPEPELEPETEPKRLMAGYCHQCRAWEMEVYDTLIWATDALDAVAKHKEACRQAGCLHPAIYRLVDQDDDDHDGLVVEHDG